MLRLKNDMLYRMAAKFCEKASKNSIVDPLLSFINVFDNSICATDSLIMFRAKVENDIEPGIYHYNSGVMIPCENKDYYNQMSEHSFNKFFEDSKEIGICEVTVNPDLIGRVFAAAKLAGKNENVFMRIGENPRRPIRFHWWFGDVLCEALCMPAKQN